MICVHDHEVKCMRMIYCRIRHRGCYVLHFLICYVDFTNMFNYMKKSDKAAIEVLSCGIYFFAN